MRDGVEITMFANMRGSNDGIKVEMFPKDKTVMVSASLAKVFVEDLKVAGYGKKKGVVTPEAAKAMAAGAPSNKMTKTPSQIMADEDTKAARRTK